HWKRSLYANKTPRFLTSIGICDHITSVDDAESVSDLAIYEEEGRCPLSYDFEWFLNELALNDNFLATGLDLLPYNSFNQDLYEEISGLNAATNSYANSMYDGVDGGNVLT